MVQKISISCKQNHAYLNGHKTIYIYVDRNFFIVLKFLSHYFGVWGRQKADKKSLFFFMENIMIILKGQVNMKLFNLVFDTFKFVINVLNLKKYLLCPPTYVTDIHSSREMS